MKRLLKNFLLGVAFVAVVVLSTRVSLLIITQHGKGRSVPNLVGQPLGEAKYIAEKEQMQTVVVDSVHVGGIARGAVYGQNPSAGSLVKKGRKIYLTINALGDKMVQVPDLVGLSLRQASSEITTRGLKVGKISYVHDLAAGNVLRQKYAGEPIERGVSLPAGSEIDLTVGMDDEMEAQLFKNQDDPDGPLNPDATQNQTSQDQTAKNKADQSQSFFE